MANKYDDIIAEEQTKPASAPPAAPANKYDAIIQEDTQSSHQVLKQNMAVAVKQNPDQRAKSMQLSAQSGLPPDVVERNYEAVNQTAEMNRFNPDRLVKTAPGLSKWLTKPDNAVIARDDIKQLKNVENEIQHYGFVDTVGQFLGRGAAQTVKGISQIPAVTYNLLAWPQNVLYKAMGKPDDYRLKAPDWLMNNPVAERQTEITQYYEKNNPLLNESFLEAAGDGDFARAGKIFAGQVVGVLPQLSMLAAGAWGNLPRAAMTVAGGSTAAQAMEQNEQRGVDPVIGTPSAILKGGAEALFEKTGTFGLLKSWEMAIAKDFGKQSSKEIMKEVGKTFVYGMFSEATEEAATSMAQDLIDYSTGTDPNALEGFWTKAAESGLVGAGAGAGMVGPTGISMGYHKKRMAAGKAKQDKEFFLALAEKLEETKLKSRLPEATRELVAEMTKDGPVENIYMPSEKFIEYFQSKKESPSKIASDLGISKQLDEAIETGADLVIPTAVWAEKMIGTEHHQALANDVRFSADGKTVNESKQDQEETRQAVAETEKEAAADITEKEVSYQKSAKTVKENVYEQLKAAGVAPSDAKAQAEFNESIFLTLGNRSGHDPLELFNKYGLTINGRQQQGTVMNQGTKPSIVVEKDGELSGEIAGKAKISGQTMSVDSAEYWFEDGNKTVADVPYDNIAIIEHLYVEPKNRKSGYGKKLVEDFILKAKESGVEAIYLNASPMSENKVPLGAIKKFYQSIGFEVFDDMKTNIIMVLDLKKYDEKTVLNQTVSPLGFYSRLEQTIEQKMGNSQPVSALRAMLKDIKPEEMKWSGLDEFLKGKENVTKSEVLDFIRGNQIEIKEVTLGDYSGHMVGDNRGMVHRLFVNDDYVGAYNNVREAERKAETIRDEYEYEDVNINIDEIPADDFNEAENPSGGGITKYGQYTLPGGENYREVLLTMPPREQAQFTLEQDKNTKRWQIVNNNKGKVVAEYYENQKSDADQALEWHRKHDMPSDNYKSSHFDEQNILAHVRLKDRTDSDGKKVLFVEEIQSDWHQAGRKKGYKQDFTADDKKRSNELRKEIQVARSKWESDIDKKSEPIQKEIDAIEKQGPPKNSIPRWRENDSGKWAWFADGKQLSDTFANKSDKEAARSSIKFPADVDRWQRRSELIKQLDDLRGRFDSYTDVAEHLVKNNYLSADVFNEFISLDQKENKSSAAVPDAPFKKTWHEFALKRILRMAADGGYDKVAWTTGEQQAERFDLSKQVDEIRLSPYADGGFQLIAKKNGMDVMRQEITDISEAEDYIGKEPTQKLQEKFDAGEKSPELSGLELKIGGDGMKGFYDNILVKSAEKLVKKFGGKVGVSEVAVGKEVTYKYVGPDLTSSQIRDKLDKYTHNNPSAVRNNPEVIDQIVLYADALDAGDPDAARFLSRNSVVILGGDIVQSTKNSETKVHSIDITPELSQAAINEGFTLFQEARGKISFGSDRKFNIELLKDANLSTFLHESGHFYLEILGDLAEADGANQQIKDDYATLLNWFGVQSRDQITVEHHEQFARGFEAYLMEGKSPSSKMRKVFARFKLWLVNIYKSVQGLDVQLSDEVRRVMDRLVATDEEIFIAEGETSSMPLFSDPVTAGMSDAKAAAYLEATEEARLFAEEKLTSELMETIRREKTKEYREKRKLAKDLITTQVDDSKEFKAQAFLQRGRLPDGSKFPDGVQTFKIDRQELVNRYGAEFVKSLPRPYIYVREGGMHPDTAAQMLGFENGHHLVMVMAKLPPRSQYIESQVDETMMKSYPDLLNSPELPQKAIDAYHNEHKAKKLRLELEHLASYNMPVLKEAIRRVARRVPTEADVRTQTEQIIGKQAVRDIKPHIYLRAEIKAANEAGKLLAKGDIDGAFMSKRRELINHELYRAATLAKADVEKTVKSFKKFGKKDEDVAKTRDVDLVNAARAVLTMFGLDRAGKSVDDYLSKMADYDPERYQTVKVIVDSATRAAGPYKDVSYDDFVAMKEAVNSLWSLAKSSQEMTIDGKKIDNEIILDELIAKTVETTSKKDKAKYNKTADKHDQFKVKLLGARASLTRVETLVDVMDVKFGGPFRKYIWQPIAEATEVYRDKKKEVFKKYEEVLRKYEGTLTKEPIEAVNLNFVFRNKAELMMAVLHTGNESNLQKLLIGRGWGTLNPDGSLNRDEWDKFILMMQRNGTLTKTDYDFAQQVWDLLESLKPDAQQAHKQMYGYYFNEVTSNSFETMFGTYRGGYVPARVDTFANEDAAIRKEREDFEKNNNSYQFPTTGRGFTKSRVDSYSAPLSLDMNLLGSHMDSVLRFTYIEPRVKEVSRIVMNKSFRKALAELDPTLAKDALIPWLQRAAQQQVVMPAQDGIGKFVDAVAGFLRQNVATQIMFGNITNTLQQTTGLVVAMTKVKPRYIRNSLARYVSNHKKTVDGVLEKSSWLRQNQDSSIYDIANSINEIILNPSVYEKAQTFAKKHTYFFQSITQNAVNTIVWQGSYDQAIEQKMDEKEAIRFADSVVRTTQGSNRPEDISRFETGTKTELLFKQFVGYFNMLANLNAGELIKIQREIGLKKGAGKAFYIYLTGLAVPAILSDAIVMLMSGKGLDQDDDDEYLDDILKSFFASQFKTIAATVPYGGQFAVAAYNKAFTENRADDRVSLSPAISVLEGVVGTPVEVYKNIADDANNEKKVVKDGLMLIGVMTGVPTGPLGRPLGYLMDVNSGKADPTGPIDFTRGLISGKPGR